MRHRRLIPIVLLLTLVSPTSTLGATPAVTVDNSAGNVIASGAVVKSDPGSALVTVTNGYHFWVAVDLQPAVGGASLRPASIFEDVGGLYAAGGLIGPGGTAAWDGKFDPATGGSQAVRLHYELTSAGGAAALAGNLLTIIADSLGASTSVATPEGLLKALTLVTDLPTFVDLSQAVQKQDIWGVVTTVELLLQSGTGRTTLRAALSDVGVVATDKQLLSAGSVVGIMDWAWTLIDMMRSSVGDHFDGTVTFSVAPVPIVVGPPLAPTGLTFADLTVPSYDLVECTVPVGVQGLCGKVRVAWQWSGPSKGTQLLIYWIDAGSGPNCAVDPNQLGDCSFPPWAQYYQQRCMESLDYAVLVGSVDPGLGTVDLLTPPPEAIQCVYVVAQNQAGSSGKVWAKDVTPH